MRAVWQSSSRQIFPIPPACAREKEGECLACLDKGPLLWRALPLEQAPEILGLEGFTEMKVNAINADSLSSLSSLRPRENGIWGRRGKIACSFNDETAKSGCTGE